jgi:hypothetical protein
VFGPIIRDNRNIGESYLFTRDKFTVSHEQDHRVLVALSEENAGHPSSRHEAIRTRCNVASALGGRNTLCSREEMLAHLMQRG